MKLPNLSTRQRWAVVAGVGAVVVLIVVGIALRGGGDEADEAGRRSTSPNEQGGDGGGSGATGEDDDDGTEQADQGMDATTTTVPGTTIAPDEATSTTAPGATTAPEAPVAGGTDDDPAGGGAGADTSDGAVVDEADAQSPPATNPAGPQGPITGEGCAPTGPPRITPSVTDGPSGDGGSWVTVGAVDGNCGATSGTFATSGVDTRLLFRSDADQMNVFIVEVADEESNGGYADLECRSACAGTRILVNRAGQYRLKVDATDGPWVVELQEYRR